MELPIDTAAPRETQCIQALRIGHARGWFEFLYTEGTGPRRFHILIDGRPRELTPDEVLPWVLGVADATGQPELVTYRHGL